MTVHVKLSTTLRRAVPGYAPEKGLFLEFDGSRTAGDVARHLHLPLDDIKIVMVNGAHASLDQLLADGDRVAFFPAVGGG